MKLNVNIIDFIINMNVIPFFSLVLLLIVSQNSIFNRSHSKFFNLAIILNIIAIVAISIDYYIMHMRINAGNLYLLRRFTSFLNFALCPVISLFLLIVINKKLHWGFYIPIIINSIVCFLSMFVKTVFFITHDNGYHRGPLFLLPVFITIIYLVGLILSNVKSHSQTRKHERIFLFLVIFLVIFGIILEVFYYLVFVSWGFASLCITLYFLLLNANSLIIDPLTSVFNRIMYEKYIRQLDNKKDYGIAVIDINDFKLVNDNFGHEVGDQYLKSFGELLNKHLYVCQIYRVGGDEFTCVFKKSVSLKFEAGIKQLFEESCKIDIIFSYGIEYCQKEKSITETIRNADAKMYQQKNAFKIAK